jgi:hypothetical protein
MERKDIITIFTAIAIGVVLGLIAFYTIKHFRGSQSSSSQQKDCVKDCGTNVCGASNCDGQSCGSCSSGTCDKGQCSKPTPPPPPTGCEGKICGDSDHCGDGCHCGANGKCVKGDPVPPPHPPAGNCYKDGINPFDSDHDCKNKCCNQLCV